MQIILKCWTTNEFCDDGIECASVALTPGNAQRYWRHHQSFQHNAGSDRSLDEWVFWDELPVFFSGYAESLLPDDALTEPLVFDLLEQARHPDGTPIDSQGWDEVMPIADLAIPEGAIQEIETCRAHIDRRGVCWTCCPKYADVVITTATIAWDALRQWMILDTTDASATAGPQLTREQKTAYLESAGSHCPYCGAEDIEEAPSRLRVAAPGKQSGATPVIINGTTSTSSSTLSCPTQISSPFEIPQVRRQVYPCGFFSLALPSVHPRQ